MLFMGGIITSCIDNPEPQGVLAMREAHAEYLRALAKLTEANKAVVDAEAAFRQAEAAVQQAIARNKNANAEAKEIANAVAKAAADAAIDSILDAMKITQANNAADLADAQAELAKAQKDLEDALNAIELERLGLSQEEVDAIDEIRFFYNYWATKLKNKLNEIKTADQNKFNWLVKALEDAALDGAEMAYYVDSIETLIDLKELELAFAESDADFWQGILYDMNFDYLAEAQMYENAARELDEDITVLLRDSVLFEQEFGFARDEAYRQADTVFNDAIKEPTADFEAAEQELADALHTSVPYLRAFLGVTFDPLAYPYGYYDWAKAPKAGYEFEAPYQDWQGNWVNLYLLPKHDDMAPIDLIKLYADSLNFISDSLNNNGFDPHFYINDDTLFVYVYGKDSAAYSKVVDTVWSGKQPSKGLIEQPTGLWSLYEDFGRSLLYDLNTKGIEADSSALKAWADSMMKKYKETLAILKAAEPGHGDALMKKWSDKVAGVETDLAAKKALVDSLTNHDGEAKNDVYYYDDKVNVGLSGDGPAIRLHYDAVPRVITNSDNTIVLTDVATPWFTPDPTNKLTIAGKKADSVAVVNAIKEYFAAIASVNAKAVPYLKFITADKIGNFKVDSVRADQIEFEGFQMVPSNTYLKGKGIEKVATYDNKGVNDPKVDLGDPAVYVDALTNLVDLFNAYVHGDARTLGAELYGAWDDAYKTTTPSVAEYAAWVKDYDTANRKNDTKLGRYPTNAAEFAKYSAMTDEGKAVAAWLKACKDYYGVDGFGDVADKNHIFFDYNTFTDPSWVVVFESPAAYTITKGKVTAMTNAKVVSGNYSHQYKFVKNTIKANLAKFDGTYTAAEYLADAENCKMAESSLVFKALNAAYAYYASTHTDSFNEIWTALGDLLKQVKKDMDAVYTSAANTQASNNHIAEMYNEILYIYREAIGDAAEDWEDATDAADEAYLEAYEEILHPTLHELATVRAEQDHLKALANALRGAYATQYGQGDAAALKAYILGKYNAAISSCGDLARDIEKLEQELDKLEAAIERFASDPTAAYNPAAPAYTPGDWKKNTIIFTDEALEELAAEIDFINAILDGFADDELAEIEYWYSYWAAVYDAAIQWVNEKGE